MKNSLPASLLAAWALAGCGAPEEAAEREVVVAVRTASARIGDVEAIQTAPATIFPRSQAKPASKLTAPIARLGVKKGDRVAKGRVLAWLRSEDYEAQLAQAEARVEEALATFEKVSAGSLPAEMERARGQLEQADAALAEAEQIFERRKTLVEEGALPERELLLARTRYEQAQTARRVAGTNLELLSNQSRLQDMRIAESRLSQAKAQRRVLQAQVSFAKVESPSSGVVTEQYLYPGDMAGPDAPIFKVMDLSVVVARAQFPEESMGGLRRAQECRFVGLDAPGVSHAGKLTVVNQAIDPIRRTVEVWCEIANRDGALRAGVFGQTKVVTAVRREAVSVPLAAVQFDDDRAGGTVWTVGGDQRAHENRVRTGVVSDESVEIVEGLGGGETVVIEGGYGLSEGLALRIVESSE